ncbi:NAD(P)-binding protein [Sistotremastrum niveocremeum HHB9708]|uniref:NAD(P)-binding protein n=1 Tax=Sistotremastrum niveocremeum HHB9708 TaxID=1314777 RepID=A0A164XQQ6_9AGAM|nr:NAD(P)-binding protein [Sistotremastrum niveocremeum HHB9708]
MSLSPSHSDHHTPSKGHAGLPFSRPPTPSVHTPVIGWVGLGAMGYQMAKNLATHSHSHPAGSGPVLVYNRTASRTEALLKELGHKVRVADSPAQIALECDVIFTSLGTDEAVKSVYAAFKAALENAKLDKPKIFVETSTIYPTLAGELDSLLSSIEHTHFLTAPVFGPPAAAAKSQLVMVMSGDYRSKKVVGYLVVPGVVKKVIDLGGNVEKAPTFKLLGNSLILGSIELLGEAMTLADKSGVGTDNLYEFVKDFMPAAPFLNYGKKMLDNEFDGSKGFAIDGGIKDATHIRRLLTAHNSPMPVIDIAHQHLLTARALHQAEEAKGVAKNEILDWSALVAGSRVAAGRPPFTYEEETKVVKE